MVIEAGVVTGYVIAWAVRKLRRAGAHLDSEVDAALEAGLDRLHRVVSARLGQDPALADLATEVATLDGQVSELTRQRVELSLQSAATKDPDFAQTVLHLIEQIRASEAALGVSALGQTAVAVSGDVRIHAESGSAAAWNMGDVSLAPHPDSPSSDHRSV